MGKTIIEKIIQSHTDDEVRPGRIVWMDLDIRTARDFGGPNVVKHYEREYRKEPVADPAKTFFTFDLCVPASTLKYADNQQICRDFAKQYGITVFDVDKGIGSHVLMEEGLANAGKTVVGTDSHLNILGAVGCFGQGMGDVDITFAFKTGKTWFEVPESLKVTIKGEFAWPTSAKDLTLFILKKLKTEKAALKSVEFYGDAVKNLKLSGRITLCSMVTEMAGITGFVPEYESPFEQAVLDFSGKKMIPVRRDRNAEYSEEVEIDVSGLPPQVAAPSLPTNVFSVSELTGTEIHSGFIGSCTNGRLEDLRQAARVLKGKKVKESIMLKIVPATQKVYSELLHEGLLADLFRSGAIISNPGCGGCAEGHIGLTGRGEVQISTGNRNFAGKQGKGSTYLASPAVVAASCVRGEICNPEDL
ncbi:MAG: aconitase/3-isopropylmalate dehydratase large subunit family protein [Candidatus Aminicenantes bacterium]|jgi:3-isopropylmalate/(R)-2-methylmalate dehydratase large subunit